MKTFEEYRVISPPASWTLLALLAAAILAWGLFVKRAVPDTPRTHHYGALPDAPGQSIYSTSPTPQGVNAPPQIQPLPVRQNDAETLGNDDAETRGRGDAERAQDG